MNLSEAQEMFKAGGSTPASLYEASYAYGQAKGFDPMITGDWNQARMLLQSIARPHAELVGEALGLWMIDSNMMDVQGVAERTGFNETYIRAELGKNALRGYKRGKGWLISKRAFREWYEGGKRKQPRGNHSRKRGAK